MPRVVFTEYANQQMDALIDNLILSRSDEDAILDRLELIEIEPAITAISNQRYPLIGSGGWWVEKYSALRIRVCFKPIKGEIVVGFVDERNDETYTLAMKILTGR